MEDDSIAVNEPQVENSGLPQGNQPLDMVRITVLLKNSVCVKGLLGVKGYDKSMYIIKMTISL